MSKARRSLKGPAGPAPHGRPRQHAVLLVHGILGQGFIYWNLVKRYLRGDRYHVHEVRLPFFGFGDLRKSAAHLAQVVDEVLTENPTETTDGRVDIVAHSAGGLAARHYIKFLGGERTVHALVTLGTPHHGTYFSAIFPLATVVRQTLPGSDFMQELNEGTEAPGGVSYTSIYSETDGVVLPPSSAVLDGAENVRVPRLTHWGFLWRPRVYEVIRSAIDHPPKIIVRGKAPTRAERGSGRTGAS